MADQWNSNYPSYVSIRLVCDLFHYSVTESKHYDDLKRAAECSAALLSGILDKSRQITDTSKSY